MILQDNSQYYQDNFRALGIDFGDKAIGLATYKKSSDPFPLGLDRIVVKNQKQIFQEIKEIIDNEIIEFIVIGLPSYLDGKESNQTKKVKQFANQLDQELNDIPIFLQNENLTSKEAEYRMKNSAKYNFKVDKKRIDELSAIIILELFFKIL